MTEAQFELLDVEQAPEIELGLASELLSAARRTSTV